MPCVVVESAPLEVTLVHYLTKSLCCSAPKIGSCTGNRNRATLDTNGPMRHDVEIVDLLAGWRRHHNM